jgi:hypothetical protein
MISPNILKRIKGNSSQTLPKIEKERLFPNSSQKTCHLDTKAKGITRK